MTAFAALQSSPANLVERMGLKPGRWHTTIRITAATAFPLSGKAVPARLEEELRKKIGSSAETEDCVGSKKGPNGDLILPGIKIASDCNFGEVEADRNRLKLRASCGSVAEGFKADVSMVAMHTDVKMTARAETSAISTGVGYGTKVSVTTSSSYVGQCPGR